MGFMTQAPFRRAVRRAFSASAFLAATFVAGSCVVAQEQIPASATPRATLTDGTQPVVIVTTGSVNKLMQDINYVTGVAGQPQFGGMFSMMAGVYAQGMDMNRPLGVLVTMAESGPEPIVVLPTRDVKAILKRLEAQTGPIDELDDGTLVVTVGPNTLFIQQNADTAVASRNRDALKLAPADVGQLFAGMGNEFDLAVRLHVQQIPVAIRNSLTDQMRQGFESAMRENQDAESARQMAETSIAQLERLIQDADELNLGFNIDPAARQILVNFSFSAVSGTELAAIYGGQQSIPSRFSSVIRDDAAAFLHTASSISPEAVDQTQQSLDNTMTVLRGALSQDGNLTEQQIDEIERYVGKLAEIVNESLAEGKIDTGALVLAGQDKFQAVLGSFVGDGTKVAALAKDLATKVPDNEKAPKFKFDIGTFQGVTMHMIEGDIPENEEEARKLFGEKIQIHIGTAPKAVYVAVGKGSEQLLKDFITAGESDAGGDRPLSQFKVRLLPIMELAQSVESNDAIAAMTGSLMGSPDRGEITIVSESIPNGSSSSVRIGEGLLRAIGAAIAAQQQQQQPAF